MMVGMEGKNNMTHVRRRTIVLLVVSMPISVLIAFLCSKLIMRPITPHVGDGQFQNISWRFPWGTVGIPITGYSITFERFDLAKGYTASYTLEKVPDIGKCLEVYLCVVDSRRTLRDESTRRSLQAEIQFDVFDEHGRLVCHVKKPIAQMDWADPQGGTDCYGLYSLGQSQFFSRKDMKYTLHVRYSPDPQLSGFRGFVFVRCGGFA